MSSMVEKIKTVFIDKLGVTLEELTPQANIINDLGADSLDLVELKMELEKEFMLSINNEEAIQLKTVGDVIAYFNNQVGN